MTTALQLAEGNVRLTEAVIRCRKLLHRRSMMAAAASAIPVPGMDWALDAALLSRLIPEINAAFGLTPAQIGKLEPRQREQLQKALTTVGSGLIGKVVTRELVLKVLKTVGVRLTAAQAAKYVPLAGQAVAAAAGYSALRYLGEQHLKDCVRVALQAQLLLPAPAPA